MMASFRTSGNNVPKKGCPPLSFYMAFVTYFSKFLELFLFGNSTQLHLNQTQFYELTASSPGAQDSWEDSNITVLKHFQSVNDNDITRRYAGQLPCILAQGFFGPLGHKFTLLMHFYNFWLVPS